MINSSKIDSLELQDLRKLVVHLFERVADLEKRVSKSEQENLELIDKNITISTEVDELKTGRQELERKLEKSEKQVVLLEKEKRQLLDKLHRKNSRNSSIPPSKDENRPTRDYSLREKSGKKVGGQKGHKGTTLKFSATPTKIVNHVPKCCDNCGQSLNSVLELVTRRQIIDIPPIEPEIIEHRVYSQKCSCGHCTKGEIPKHLKNNTSPVSYGPRVEALIGYMNVRQYIAMERMQEFLNQVFGLEITVGTICNKLAKVSKKLLPHYTWIYRQISKSKVAGSDETGCRVNGKKGWIWAWQNELFTYLAYSSNRGNQTIEEHFPKGLPASIMVHDCYSAQFNIACRGHQICTAHLLRELNYFIEKGDEWSIKFKHQLKESLKLLKKMVL